MSNILTIGYITEGPTDERFLTSIIERTFTELAFACKGVIEIFPPQHLKTTKTNFSDKVFEAATIAEERGLMVLCVHTDADHLSDERARRHRIDPSFNKVQTSTKDHICKNLVAIVPIQMTEAWLLADNDLFLQEIMTTDSLHDLGIASHPEQITDPKSQIKNAIQLAFQDRPRRHRQQVRLADLYGPIGQRCDLNRLRELSSFQKFEQEIKNALQSLNLM